MTPFNLVTFLIGTLFLFGMLTSIAGILILTFRASSSEVKTIAAQTVRLAQKGLAEDVAGLVGNATNLVDAINQLVRTNRGVGIFPRARGIADLACGHEEPDRTAIGIGDGVQLGVHAPFGSADRAPPLVSIAPFFDRRLLAVRCALR